MGVTGSWRVVLPLLLATGCCHAQMLLQPDQLRGWFAGLGAGTVQLEGRCTAIGRDTGLLTACEHNDASSAYRIYLGYRLNRYLAVESGYARLGRSERGYHGTTERPSRLPGGIAFSGYERFQIRGYTLAAVFTASLLPQVNLYGKAGGFLWHQRFDAGITTPAGSHQATVFESGPDTTGGVGLEFVLAPQWSLRAGWEYFAADGDHQDFYHMDLLWRQGSS
jgi:hypothetical protein